MLPQGGSSQSVGSHLWVVTAIMIMLVKALRLAWALTASLERHPLSRQFAKPREKFPLFALRALPDDAR